MRAALHRRDRGRPVGVQPRPAPAGDGFAIRVGFIIGFIGGFIIGFVVGLIVGFVVGLIVGFVSGFGFAAGPGRAALSSASLAPAGGPDATHAADSPAGSGRGQR
jgi:hypothetical protein